MSQAKGTFTFRLDERDRAALDRIAARMACDRGAVLRQLIQRADQSLEREGCFVANSRQFRVKLVPKEGEA
jgi:predicted transcriptional regulator